jgi:hypothetical protein
VKSSARFQSDENGKRFVTRSRKLLSGRRGGVYGGYLPPEIMKTAGLHADGIKYQQEQQEVPDKNQHVGNSFIKMNAQPLIDHPNNFLI